MQASFFFYFFPLKRMREELWGRGLGEDNIKMLSSQVSLRYNSSGVRAHMKISNTALASSSCCPRPAAAAAPSPGEEWGWRTLWQLQLCWEVVPAAGLQGLLWCSQRQEWLQTRGTAASPPQTEPALNDALHFSVLILIKIFQELESAVTSILFLLFF